MANNNFQKQLFAELQEFILPIVKTGGDRDRIFEFFEFVGWDIHEALGTSADDIVNIIDDFIITADFLFDLIDNPPSDFLEFVTALDETSSLLSSFQQITDLASDQISIDTSELLPDILNALAILYIYRKYPRAFNILELLTIIRNLPEQNIVNGGRLMHLRNQLPRLELNRLNSLVTNPVELFREEYWPDGFTDQVVVNEFVHKLFPKIKRVLSETNKSRSEYSVDGLFVLVGRGAGPDELSAQEELILDGMMTLGWSFYQAEVDAELEFGASIGIIPEDQSGPGVFTIPYGHVAFSDDLGGWNFKLESDIGTEGFEITSAGFNPYSSGRNSVNLYFQAKPISDSEIDIIIGPSNATHIEIGEFSIQGGFEFSDSLSNIEGTILLQRAALVINAGDGDGFLNALFPNDGARVEFDLEIGWSNIDGFHIKGSGGLAIQIPVHLDLGSIEFNALTIKMVFSNDVLSLEIGGSIKVNLDPLTVVVEDLGVRFNFSFPERGGNLGLINLSPEFKPPTRAGLTITTSSVIGGGFLDFDTDNERYAGILELQIGEIGLLAIGLITTILPDNRKGFSLLVNIGVTFDPAIELFSGFSLSAVGGVIAANRSMDIEALQRGVKNRTLDSILFPDPSTVISNASKIISDMRSVFPATEGQFIVGPMVRIGWGYPNIVVAEIGVFIEFPDPVRIVLMGQVLAILPEQNNALVLIQLDVLGVLDFEKEELTFQASLYDSRVLSYPISGDAAFLYSFSKINRRFAFSAGGFHPKFITPSPTIIFSDLKRLTITISKNKKFQLTSRAYIGLPPDTLQFGARVDLYASSSGAVLTGYLGFDVPHIYFTPFTFKVWIGAGINVRYKGKSLADVTLSLWLSGTTPWNARGSVKIEALFLEVKIKFNKTWGSNQQSTIAPENPWDKLQPALLASRNWGSALPRGRKIVESLRGTEGESVATGVILLHPMGRLEIIQNIVPLATHLDKLGNAPVKIFNQFEIKQVSVNGNDGNRTIIGINTVNDFFSRGQFEEIPNHKKLSSPSFEKMPGGVITSSSDLSIHGPIESQELAYESIIINTDRTSEKNETHGLLAWIESITLLKSNEKKRVALRSGSQTKFRTSKPTPRVIDQEEQYCVAMADSLTRANGFNGSVQGDSIMTNMAADYALKEHLIQNPGDAGKFIVVSEHELTEVA